VAALAGQIIGLVAGGLVAGPSARLPEAMSTGLTQQGIPPGVAHDVGALPPVATLFSAVLGVNPLEHLLGPTGALTAMPTDLCDPCRAGGDRVVAAGPRH
jgi:hypothetical protein